MNESVMAQMAQIEDSFKNLPAPDQLLLIERLVHQVNQVGLAEARRANQDANNDIDDQLALMAADPQIQDELNKIGMEFAIAAAYGLETI